MGTIVVVGAGIAGLRTVQQLRLRGCVEQIVVLGGEEHVPYDRPPLSKAVLRGERGLPGLLSDEQLAELGAEWRLGTTAREVDTVARKVLTDSGALDYDTLVLATGAVPRRVPLLPGDVLRTWDDAQRIRASLRPGATVAVIGAGLIGCEVAASATALGAEVHLIDVLPGPMTRVVGPAVAPMIGDIHRQRGVHLHTSTNVAAAEEDSLSLSDGSLLRPDLVLHAIGVVPDTDWLIGSGLVLSDGVVCDDNGRTAFDGVYAVGDVAAWGGRRAEHWSSAVEQAARVAAAITSQPAPPPETTYWWSDQYDLKIQGLGTSRDADEVRSGLWGPAGRTVVLYGRSGALIGAVGISAAGGVMRLRAEIDRGAPLDEVSARFADVTVLPLEGPAPG